MITALSNTTLTAGSSDTVTGKQLSGLTQGASFGDDEQADTNFPLVRITNTSMSDVFYAPTSGFSRSIAPGAASSTSFSVPAGIETGAASLAVIANGVAFDPVSVTVATH